jgi:hypothetical protein
VSLLIYAVLLPSIHTFGDLSVVETMIPVDGHFRNISTMCFKMKDVGLIGCTCSEIRTKQRSLMNMGVQTLEVVCIK